MQNTSVKTQLAHCKAQLDEQRISALFTADPQRAERFSISESGIHLDFSKQCLDDAALRALQALAHEHQLAEAFEALTRGDLLNTTEDRPALHTLLRGTRQDIQSERYAEVATTLVAMQALVTAVHDGSRRGFRGERFTDVVNIGIGGSDLGPRMVCRALHTPNPLLRPHFIANVDPQDLDEVLAPLNPATTLFIVCSKSFTTEETLTNALRARQWLIAAGAQQEHIKDHVVAVTTHLSAAAEFGIDKTQCYPMWDWVGGRYSVWSAIGLIIALHRGWDVFSALLAGARQMDEHTAEMPPASNVPMTMALLEYWNTQYLGTDTHVILPYAHRLSALPDFLQQLTMESNGKRTSLDNEPSEWATAPVLWGSAGTIGQHSYYQLLHQGNRPFSADIILPLRNGTVDLDAHRKLAANALAQSRALMIGRSATEAIKLACERGQDPALAPHFEMPGNHPHSLLIIDIVSPTTLGALIAAYEHKTFFLSRLLNINPFDQWGVELGKVIGKQILSTLADGYGIEGLDGSTAAAVRAWRLANPSANS